MECCSLGNTVTFLRIFSLPALVAVCQVLGSGVGLGLAKKRPTKSMPTQYCPIGDILTSVECGPQVPAEMLVKPDRSCSANGIDFIYSKRNRNLTCTICFSKITVKVEADATSRITIANVNENPQSGVYVNVWFQYNGSLLEVQAINGNDCICSYVEEELDNVNLPLHIVKELVAQFRNN
jgi:hypothetical protein